MSDVIERLRASKRKVEDPHTTKGREDGKRWAENQAEAFELQRIATAIDDIRKWTDESKPVWAKFSHLIDPDRYDNDNNAADFWREQDLYEDNTSLVNNGFVVAFAEGAVDVWEQVKKAL